MERGEKEGADSLAGKADPGAFLQPKEYLPPAAGLYPPVRTSLSGGRKAADSERQEIVITLGDVLARIPTQLLQAGLLDDRRELRFSIDDLSADIARGRAAVPLSKIAALCPGVFAREITAADDIEIRLPLQKLVEQIGLLRGRPARRPAPSVAVGEAGGFPDCHAAGQHPSPEEPASTFDGEKIHLHLTAILPGCPREIIIGALPPIAEGVRLALPYALLEAQFAQDRVEVSARSFVAALPRSLQPYFEPREGVQVPLPIEEILQNLPGPPPPAPVAVTAPVDAASLEAADAQVELAEFLAQADDQSLAPALVGEPHSASASEPPFALPDPAEVAAQTPRMDGDAPRVVTPPPAGEETPEPEARVVFAEAPAPPVFAPPPVRIAPPEVVVESAPSPVKDLAPVEPAPAAPAVIPSGLPIALFMHPPPPVRPVLVQPPPIFATAPPVPSPSAPPAPAEPPAPVIATVPAAAAYAALQPLFMTDDALDLAAVCRHAAELPGVQGCAIARREARAVAGKLRGDFNFEALLSAAQRLEGAAGSVAGAASFGAWQNLTLHGESAALSLFVRPGLLLAVLHRPLPPGVRERLATVAEVISPAGESGDAQL